MKMPTFRPKQKLRATATRRTAAPSRADEEEEYEEPSMKFSSAFIIVVLLHLVAVGGIFAFESIKVKQPGTAAAAEAASVAPAAEAPTAPVQAAEPAREVKTAATRTAPAAAPAAVPTKATAPAKTVAAAAPAKTVEAPKKTQKGVADSGKVHVVAKGENPHSIARKLGVSYDALVKLNGIDDPRRLQIGQKLQVPAH